MMSPEGFQVTSIFYLNISQWQCTDSTSAGTPHCSFTAIINRKSEHLQQVFFIWGNFLSAWKENYFVILLSERRRGELVGGSSCIPQAGLALLPPPCLRATWLARPPPCQAAHCPPSPPWPPCRSPNLTACTGCIVENDPLSSQNMAPAFLRLIFWLVSPSHPLAKNTELNTKHGCMDNGHKLLWSKIIAPAFLRLLSWLFPLLAAALVFRNNNQEKERDGNLMPNMTPSSPHKLSFFSPHRSPKTALSKMQNWNDAQTQNTDAWMQTQNTDA